MYMLAIYNHIYSMLAISTKTYSQLKHLPSHKFENEKPLVQD